MAGRQFQQPDAHLLVRNPARIGAGFRNGGGQRGKLGRVVVKVGQGAGCFAHEESIGGGGADFQPVKGTRQGRRLIRGSFALSRTRSPGYPECPSHRLTLHRNKRRFRLPRAIRVRFARDSAHGESLFLMETARFPSRALLPLPIAPWPRVQRHRPDPAISQGSSRCRSPTQGRRGRDGSLMKETL